MDHLGYVFVDGKESGDVHAAAGERHSCISPLVFPIICGSSWLHKLRIHGCSDSTWRKTKPKRLCIHIGDFITFAPMIIAAKIMITNFVLLPPHGSPFSCMKTAKHNNDKALPKESNGVAARPPRE